MRVALKDAILVRAHIAYAHALMGHRELATEVLNGFLREYKKDRFPARAIAEIYIGLGNRDEAFEWLHRAVDQGDWTIFWKSDPLYEPLRADPRFARLLNRVRLS